MRFSTSGQLRRVDLTPLIDLVPVLRDEWAALQFDRKGRLVNPLTGETVPGLDLADGRHRQTGAAYRITISTPILALPPEIHAEFLAESNQLREREATPEEWAEHVARQEAAKVQVGTDEHHVVATLVEDNTRKLEFSAVSEEQHWTIDVGIEHGRLPKVELDGEVDLTALFKSVGTPGCFARLIGGDGGGSAVIDLNTLERGGRTVQGEGRANRFRGSARVDVRTAANRWSVKGRGTLRASGIARPLLWFGGRRMRRSAKRSFAGFWESGDDQMRELAGELSMLRSAIEAEGGPAPFVRRALWDADFDPGLDSLTGGRADDR